VYGGLRGLTHSVIRCANPLAVSNCLRRNRLCARCSYPPASMTLQHAGPACVERFGPFVSLLRQVLTTLRISCGHLGPAHSEFYGPLSAVGGRHWAEPGTGSARQLHALVRRRLRVTARPCQSGDAHGTSDGRPSAVPGLFVRLDLQAVHQLVEAAEQVDHCHELEDRRIV
jgi:hypothetical protein